MTFEIDEKAFAEALVSAMTKKTGFGRGPSVLEAALDEAGIKTQAAAISARAVEFLEAERAPLARRVATAFGEGIVDGAREKGRSLVRALKTKTVQGLLAPSLFEELKKEVE